MLGCLVLGLVDICSQDHASFTLVQEMHCKLPFYEELQENPSGLQGPPAALWTTPPKKQGLLHQRL